MEQNLDLWDDRVTVGEDLQMVFAAAIDAKGICVVDVYKRQAYWQRDAGQTAASGFGTCPCLRSTVVLLSL